MATTHLVPVDRPASTTPLLPLSNEREKDVPPQPHPPPWGERSDREAFVGANSHVSKVAERS